MTGLMDGRAVTLRLMSRTGERMPNVGPGELAQLREVAERVRAAQEEQKDAAAAMDQLVVELRDKFPGRGTVTAMADVITEVLGGSEHRRTTLSRKISAIKSGTRHLRAE